MTRRLPDLHHITLCRFLLCAPPLLVLAAVMHPRELVKNVRAACRRG